MKTYPLKQLDLSGAKEMQFRLVEKIAGHFDGHLMLHAGDFGLWKNIQRPNFTARVEAVLADFFGAQDACLVRGAGTGALRSIMMALIKPGQNLLVHLGPIYPTTLVTINAMGLDLHSVNFNDAESIKKTELDEVPFALIQHSRQGLEDKYTLDEIIPTLKSICPTMTIIVDDNYVAMRAPKIGIELGADVSTFSLFKLLGPEGLGCVLADQELITKIREQSYSGGTQVQGPEALEALRALTFTPVALAIQAEVVNEVVLRLNAGEVPGVSQAFVANAQSRVILVELEEPRAQEVLATSIRFGAASHPVGAESRYEVSPLFYTVSGTFQKENPQLADRMIRINPMRAGANLIINILNSSIKESEEG